MGIVYRPVGGRAARSWRRGYLFGRVRRQDIRLTRSGSTIADGAGDALGDVDSAGVAYVYTLHNDGADALTVASVATGTLSNVTSATVSGISTPVVVAPGGSTTFTVTVTPTAAGACSYTLTVTSDDPDAEATYTVSVSGTGTGFAAAYESWTTLRLSMFGGEAPTEDPFSEYTSVSEDADGWDVTANFAAVREGYDKTINWYGPLTNVWADAPTDWSLAVMSEITWTGTISDDRAAGVLCGVPSSTTKAAVTAARVDTGSSTGSVTLGPASFLNSSYSASTTKVRNLWIPCPGSVTNRFGFVWAHDRSTVALTALGGVAGHAIVGNTTGNAPQMGVSIAQFQQATNGGGKFKLVAKGAPIPRAPWDGGAGWVSLPFPGGSPDENATAYVSDGGAHASTWDVTIDGTLGNSGAGWNPSSGTKRPIWLPSLPGGIVLTRPLLYAIRVVSGWDVNDQLVAGLLLRRSTTAGAAGGIHQITTTTRRTICMFPTANQTGTADSSVLHVWGGSAPNVYGGTTIIGVVSAIPMTDTGPALVNGNCAYDSVSAASITLGIFIHNLTAGSANRRAVFEVYLHNPALDMSEDPA